MSISKDYNMETVVPTADSLITFLLLQWHFSIPVSSPEASTDPSKDLKATVWMFYKQSGWVSASALYSLLFYCLGRKCIAVTDLTRTPQNFSSTL